MNITKASLNAFREDFAKAAEALEQKYGVTIHLCSISYSDTEFTGKIEVKNEGADKVEFARYADAYGLKPEDIGRTFVHQGRSYTIAGVKYGTKYPILVTRDDGKSFKFRAEAVRGALL